MLPLGQWPETQLLPHAHRRERLPTTLYSLDETTGDYAMTNFSTARDEQQLIPYIKAALAIRPDPSLWAVPWSPPSRMEYSDTLQPGRGRHSRPTSKAPAA